MSGVLSRCYSAMSTNITVCAHVGYLAGNDAVTVLTHASLCCGTVQDSLDWFEVDLGFTKLYIQILLCVLISTPPSCSPLVLFGHSALPPPRGGSASRVSPQSCQSHESLRGS